jgi:hypothetical protein
MPQQIEVPGFGVVEFPDGMNDAQITAAIRKNTPKPVESGAQALAKQTGPGEAFMVSAGHKTDQILNGLTQAYLSARGENSALGGLAKNVASGDEAYSPLAQERPFSTAFGSALPSMAVPGAGAGYTGAAMAGALPELLSYGSAGERATRGGIGAAGGVVGRALGGLLSSILKPTGAGTTVSKDAMDAASRIGYRPMAGQATQNPALLNVENYLARTPGSSGTMQAINQGNTEAVNRAAAASVGQRGTELSPALLGAAENTIGAEFQRLQAVTAPKLGNDFADTLLKIETQNAARGPFRDPQIDGLLNKGLDLAAQGNLSGKAYKEIRSELSNQATKAFKSGDSTLGQALKGVRGALDDAAEQSLSAEDQSAWRLAREQWGNWKTLTKGLVAEGGDVSPARVAAQLRGQGPAFRTGAQGQLADIGRIGEGFKGALNPNSGNLMQAGTWGPLTVPANFLAAKAYTSPVVQSYLRNGLLDIGKNGELVVKATGVPVGVAGLKSLLGAE